MSGSGLQRVFRIHKDQKKSRKQCVSKEFQILQHTEEGTSRHPMLHLGHLVHVVTQ